MRTPRLVVYVAIASAIGAPVLGAIILWTIGAVEALLTNPKGLEAGMLFVLIGFIIHGVVIGAPIAALEGAFGGFVLARLRQRDFRGVCLIAIGAVIGAVGGALGIAAAGVPLAVLLSASDAAAFTKVVVTPGNRYLLAVVLAGTIVGGVAAAAISRMRVPTPPR